MSATFFEKTLFYTPFPWKGVVEDEIQNIVEITVVVSVVFFFQSKWLKYIQKLQKFAQKWKIKQNYNNNANNLRVSFKKCYFSPTKNTLQKISLFSRSDSAV